MKRIFEVIKKYKDQNIILPERKTKYSAGYDISSLFDVVIKPGEIKMIETGLKVKFPKNEVCLIFPRSSLSIKKYLTMPNNVGVIDADYYNNQNNEGHLMVPIYNFSSKEQVIFKGERICQAIFFKYNKLNGFVSNTKRIGGFGSSGEK